MSLRSLRHGQNGNAALFGSQRNAVRVEREPPGRGPRALRETRLVVELRTGQCGRTNDATALLGGCAPGGIRTPDLLIRSRKVHTPGPAALQRSRAKGRG